MTKSTPRSTRARATSLAASLSGAALLAAILFASPLTGCLDPSGDCIVDGVAPRNLTAVAGNGTATITWEIPAVDTSEIRGVSAQVQYDTAGEAGAQCNRYHPNDLAPGCAVACQLSGATQCTATGLVNGRTYTFTVVTQTTAPNLYCGNGTAFARTDAVTPAAP